MNDRSNKQQKKLTKEEYDRISKEIYTWMRYVEKEAIKATKILMEDMNAFDSIHTALTILKTIADVESKFINKNKESLFNTIFKASGLVLVDIEGVYFSPHYVVGNGTVKDSEGNHINKKIMVNYEDYTMWRFKSVMDDDRLEKLEKERNQSKGVGEEAEGEDKENSNSISIAEVNNICKTMH